MLPILETDRLILRPRTMDDLGSCVEMDKDPEVTEYLPRVWDGGAEHIAFLEERIMKPYPAGLGYWSVFAKENPTDFLGWVHLLPSEEDERTTDIGWRFRRSAWGKGYATEAARAILAYAFATIGSGRVTASTLSTNDRSKRMMERLGMRYVADFMYDGRLPSSAYEITKQGYLNDSTRNNNMKEQIIKFLRENIIGKTLITDEVIYKLGNGNMEGVYCDKMMFSDLAVTDQGFQFNMTTVTQEKLYKLDEKGIRKELVKDYTGTSVFRYELAMRKSTSQITGYMRCISSTVKDQTMEAVAYGVYNVRFAGEELKWDEVQLLYRDTPAGEGKYRPVAFDSRIRFYLDDGKAVFEYLPTHSDVNPDTLVKTLSKDDYPPYISREK